MQCICINWAHSIFFLLSELAKKKKWLIHIVCSFELCLRNRRMLTINYLCTEHLVITLRFLSPRPLLVQRNPFIDNWSRNARISEWVAFISCYCYVISSSTSGEAFIDKFPLMGITINGVKFQTARPCKNDISHW